MLSHAHASVPRSRPRRNIHEEIRGRELEIITALGIKWPARNHATHINCPFPDHDDADPSWRWDPRKEHWYCSCDSGSAVDAVMRMHGCDFNAAAKWCRATLFGDKPPPSFSAEELAARKAEREEEEEGAGWRAIQKKAQRILGRLCLAAPSHPYLARKKAGSHGLLRMDDLLVVPLKGPAGEILERAIHRPGRQEEVF